jgi:carbamoyltransferase
MYLLGLSSYSHDASASLLKDGELRSVLEEERFNREKHAWQFPRHAITECLKQEGIAINDVDHFTFFWRPWREVVGNAGHVLAYLPQTLNILRAPAGSDTPDFLSRVLSMHRVGVDIQKHFGMEKRPDVRFIEHHLCHAASAFFVSKFEEAAILTIDGRGESTSTMMAAGKGNKILGIKEIKVPHSLGHLYAAVTDYLGFKPFSDEWKVMGLSAYGERTYVKDFEDLLDLTKDGEYRLNLKYFRFHTHGQNKWLSDHFLRRFGPGRPREGAYEQRHSDIAFALQALVERTGVFLARYLEAATGLPNLCMTGGVVLNCLMNRRIVDATSFKDYFFQPIASDAGTSFGGALYYYHQILGYPRTHVFDSCYLGTEFSDREIETVLKARGEPYRRSGNIAVETARYIADGKIVGWFQGRMEAGPRALGNRSIAADPTDPTMKDRLNARVKKREFFRPFAPSVLQEKCHEYFAMPKNLDSPYMILIGDVREDKKKLIPAVTHNDGTARVQTVSRDLNPRYWQLIHEFEKIKGVPVLLNTSFNENEPIVCTPEDAIDCSMRVGLDVLAIGDFIVEKNDRT